MMQEITLLETRIVRQDVERNNKQRQILIVSILFIMSAIMIITSVFYLAFEKKYFFIEDNQGTIVSSLFDYNENDLFQDNSQYADYPIAPKPNFILLRHSLLSIKSLSQLQVGNIKYPIVRSFISNKSIENPNHFRAVSGTNAEIFYLRC